MFNITVKKLLKYGYKQLSSVAEKQSQLYFYV